ncbi:MAG: hypothetical protein HQ462_11455 [Deltaproteobacteria bacterium]|nr:hypothetical protein [Deltaproteobacteria bacterium]
MKFLIVVCLLINLPLLVAAENTPNYQDYIDKEVAIEIAALKDIEPEIIALQTAVEKKQTALGKQKTVFDTKNGNYNIAIELHQKAILALRDAETELNNELKGQPIYGRRGKLKKGRTYNGNAITEAGGKVGVATSALKDATKEYKNAETKYGEADEKVKAARVALEKSTADHAAKVKTKGQNEAVKTAKMAAMESNIKDLKTQIEHAEVSTKLASLKESITDNELKLAVLENTYNQGLIGDFVRVKLEGMMSDPQFCQATKACPENEATKSDFKPNLKGLFESTDRDRKKDLESH